MILTAFHEIVPEIGLTEMRQITVAYDTTGIPDDIYGLVEMYCTDSTCDCQKVTLQILAVNQDKIVATIDYGWESRAFYAKWLHTTEEDETIDMLISPSLSMFGINTSISANILEMVSTTCFTPDYIERLKKHYTLVKNKTAKKQKQMPKPKKPRGRWF